MRKRERTANSFFPDLDEQFRAKTIAIRALYPFETSNNDLAILARKKYYQLRESTAPELLHCAYLPDEKKGLSSVIAYQHYLKNADPLLNETGLSPLDKIMVRAKYSVLYGTGTCIEFSSTLFLALLSMKKYPISIATVQCNQETHTVVIIGNIDGENLSDVIVCDAWAGYTYKLSEWNSIWSDEYYISDGITKENVRIDFSITTPPDEAITTRISKLFKMFEMPDEVAAFRATVEKEVSEEINRWDQVLLKNNKYAN